MVAFAAGAAVGVCDIQPERAAWKKHALNLGKYLRQPRHILRRCVLAPDLSIHAIIPQRVIGRRGDAAMHKVVRQRAQHIQCVAAENRIKLHHAPLTSFGLVVITRYSSVSLGKRSTKGKMIFP